MPAGSTGWFWHSLARETGRIGHLYSPGDQRGPWPWFPYALDNGAFACWDQQTNTFDHDAWNKKVWLWRDLLAWAKAAMVWSDADSRYVPFMPRWAVVPDIPGNSSATLERWPVYAPEVLDAGIPLAIAVQDGMEPKDITSLGIQPDVIFVGGTTDFKWGTVEMWCSLFPRVHVGRCNIPSRLAWLESLGCESCDGTGWNRGNRKQTAGLEVWARSGGKPRAELLHPYVCRN